MFSDYYYDTLRYDMIWSFGQTDTVDGSGGQSLGSRSVGNLDGGNTLSECENPKVSTSTYSDSFSLLLSPHLCTSFSLLPSLSLLLSLSYFPSLISLSPFPSLFIIRSHVGEETIQLLF